MFIKVANAYKALTNEARPRARRARAPRGSAPRSHPARWNLTSEADGSSRTVPSYYHSPSQRDSLLF